MLFKACPRCHGDMQVNGDFYGDYKQCLQCGHIVELLPASASGLAIDKTGKKKSLVA